MDIDVLPVTGLLSPPCHRSFARKEVKPMALLAPATDRRRSDPYRPSVVRKPNSFQIHTVSVEALKPSGYLPAGQDAVVPSRFEATFTFSEPDVTILIEVLVTQDFGPVVLEFAVRGKATDPIRGILLRKVPVDHLLKRAVAEATVSAKQRQVWLATLPPAIQEQARQADEAVNAPPSARERREQQGDEDARTAARLLQEAKRAGSPAPVDDVVKTMNRSRASVQRYLRRARALNLLPKRDGPAQAE